MPQKYIEKLSWSLSPVSSEEVESTDYTDLKMKRLFNTLNQGRGR